MQVLTDCPSWPPTSPFRRSRITPRAQRAHARVADPLAAAERQRQARPPRRTRGSASSRRPRPAHSRETNCDRPAFAGLGDAELRLEALHVQPLDDPLALPVARSARRASRPGPRRTPRARASRGRARRGARRRTGPSSRCAARAAGSRGSNGRSGGARRRRSRRRASGPSGSAARRRAASRRHRLRSMLMIGRDAAARADEQQLRRERVRSMKSPSTPPSDTIAPGRPWRDEIRRHDAALDQLRGDRDAAVGPVGLGGQRVGAPVANAADVDSDPAVLAGPVARPTGTRA